MKQTENGVFLEPNEYTEFINGGLKFVEDTENSILETTSAENPSVSLYELNRQLIANLDPYNSEQLEEKKQLFREWTAETNFDNYYMFLCKELSYYTVFDCSRSSASAEQFINEFYSILDDFAQIFDIDEDNNGAIAVWANWEDGELPNCFYLFPYGKGVVRV